MKPQLTLIATALMLGLTAAPVSFNTAASAQTATAGAARQTVTFAVENMTCALCPVTVKAAMQGVEGVQSVKIDFEAKTATVIFDPARATAEAIGAASTNAGYPADARG